MKFLLGRLRVVAAYGVVALVGCISGYIARENKGCFSDSSPRYFNTYDWDGRTIADLASHYGTPVVDLVGEPDAVLGTGRFSLDTARLLSGIPKGTVVRLAVWRTECRGILRGELIAVGDAEAGRILEEDGRQRLFSFRALPPN